LPLRLRSSLNHLGSLDRLPIKAGKQSRRFGPRLVGGVPRDDVEPDPEAELAIGDTRSVADAVELLGDRVRRLAPREIDVGIARRNVERGRR